MTDFAMTDPATDAMPLAPGVAQFYVVPWADLNHSFIASGDPGATSLIVPVLADATRNVVLVFRSPAAGDKVDFLVVTAEPEVVRTWT